MERSPDKELMLEALNRRADFPVAAVVVVHDGITHMRATLEEVAIAIEYIVSRNGCALSNVGNLLRLTVL